MKNKITKFAKIPFEFIDLSLTGYQKEIIELKYYVYVEAEKKGVRRIETLDKLANELNLSSRTVQNYYYTVVHDLRNYYSNSSF